MSRLRRSATASPRAAFFLIVACLLALLATSAAHDGDDRKRDFTPETERSIKAVTLVSAALSMLGSGFILFRCDTTTGALATNNAQGRGWCGMLRAFLLWVVLMDH